MSYILINKAGSFKTNDSFIFASNDGWMFFTARQPLIAELSIGGLLFPNIKLETGEEIVYKEGASSIVVKSTVIGRYPRIIEGEPSATADSSPLIRYQHHYDAEKFVVLASFSYKRGRLEGLNFEFYPNDGLLKPGLMGKTISLKLNKDTPLIKLLKKSRKEGASSGSISCKGVAQNTGCSVTTDHDLLEVWASVTGAKRRMEVEVLKILGITL